MTGVANFPQASLAVQLAELRREKKMRAGVYPHWITTGKIKRAVADYQVSALDGAIKTLETLVAATGQPGRRELIDALRDALPYLPDTDALRARVVGILAKVPT